MRDRSRLQDLAALLPITAMLLLLPPILNLFDGGLAFGGIPNLAIYIFALWLVLVMLGAALARQLARADVADALGEVDIEITDPPSPPDQPS